MVTLDNNLSNPLDQKLHTLLGHHQYISPITTIIYISHSLHNLQYITQPTQQHTTYTIHIQQHLHTTTTLYTQLHGHVDIHAGLMHSHAGLMQVSCSLRQVSCRSHAGSCRSHAGCHAVTCTLYPYLCCMWLCINHLIPDLSYFPSMTSLFDRLCRHMT